MPFQYQAFGLPILSAIELPDLAGFSANIRSNPINIELGKVPVSLIESPTEIKPLSTFNEHEFLFMLPDIAKYYVSNGNKIIVEPLTDNWDDIRLHLYANCLAVALFQRDILPFHVSGVFTAPNKVILFAAPSRTGKSTMAVLLQQKGYVPFTDDTAVLSVTDGKCYAQASYPMARLWQDTFEKQTQFAETDKQALCFDANKFGFSFHDNFTSEQAEVVAIVFLEIDGSEINTVPINQTKGLQKLVNNVYRLQWVSGMKKQVLQFKHLTEIVKSVPTYAANRPKDIDTHQSFVDAIETQIIKKFGN